MSNIFSITKIMLVTAFFVISPKSQASHIISEAVNNGHLSYKQAYLVTIIKHASKNSDIETLKLSILELREDHKWQDKYAFLFPSEFGDKFNAFKKILLHVTPKGTDYVYHRRVLSALWHSPPLPVDQELVNNFNSNFLIDTQVTEDEIKLARQAMGSVEGSYNAQDFETAINFAMNNYNNLRTEK